MRRSMQPLAGIKILDFSTLLPGPLATLMLAQAGAQVIKVERPGRGDEMRGFAPKLADGSASAMFAALNAGKKSISLDLKDAHERARLMPLIEAADIIVEQFRPGVMARLELDYETLKQRNKALIYCSITGYGQTGPKAGEVGHDLNYMAETGVLDLGEQSAGAPTVPPVLAADIGGGTYPAIINILMALRARDATGDGVHLDISMAHGLFPFAFWALAQADATREWPAPGGARLTGGSPRYQIYTTKDGTHLSAAPLEQHFWERFCEVLGLAQHLRNDSVDPQATRHAVAKIIACKSAAHWCAAFAGVDCCVAPVRTLGEAVADPQFAGISQSIAPLPLAQMFRAPGPAAPAPKLGADNSLLDQG
ncbi:MAG: CaiB/BaiF CoA transferase family protein [Alphaproteobacteria bacterium]